MSAAASVAGPAPAADPADHFPGSAAAPAGPVGWFSVSAAASAWAPGPGTAGPLGPIVAETGAPSSFEGVAEEAGVAIASARESGDAGESPEVDGTAIAG